MTIPRRLTKMYPDIYGFQMVTISRRLRALLKCASFLNFDQRTNADQLRAEYFVSRCVSRWTARLRNYG